MAGPDRSRAQRGRRRQILVRRAMSVNVNIASAFPAGRIGEQDRAGSTDVHSARPAACIPASRPTTGFHRERESPGGGAWKSACLARAASRRDRAAQPASTGPLAPVTHSQSFCRLHDCDPRFAERVEARRLHLRIGTLRGPFQAPAHRRPRGSPLRVMRPRRRNCSGCRQLPGPGQAGPRLRRFCPTLRISRPAGIAGSLKGARANFPEPAQRCPVAMALHRSPCYSRREGTARKARAGLTRRTSRSPTTFKHPTRA